MLTVSCDPSQTPLLPGIYILATPIGNLGDITMRGVDVLTQCDQIACEDTRVTGKLLHHLGLSKPMTRYNDHSKASDRERLLQMARESSVVLVSDAGTPLISDPGFRLIQEARAANIRVTSLPGACAAIIALTVSALPSDQFFFAGFLPNKDKARSDRLSQLKSVLENLSTTLIFYENGPRLVKSLQAIADQFPGSPVAVARELTKLYEECRSASAEELIAHYTQSPPKGEIVLMVGPPPADDKQFGAEEVDALLLEQLGEHKPSRAASAVAKLTGQDRGTLYNRAIQLQQK